MRWINGLLCAAAFVAVIANDLLNLFFFPDGLAFVCDTLMFDTNSEGFVWCFVHFVWDAGV